MRRAGRPGALQSIRGVPRRRNPSGPRRCIQGESPAHRGVTAPGCTGSSRRARPAARHWFPQPACHYPLRVPYHRSPAWGRSSIPRARCCLPPHAPRPGPARAFYCVRACHVLLPGRLLYSGGVVCRVGRRVEESIGGKKSYLPLWGVPGGPSMRRVRPLDRGCPSSRASPTVVFRWPL